MRANLWLRTATRVLVRVAEFKATEFYELEKLAKKVPWHRFIAPGVAADFRVTARKSKLYHSDAIAERLAKASGAKAAAPIGAKAVSGQPRTASTQLFVVRVVKDVFEISADTSGALLHMRGYRQAVGKAPLRETLAATLLIASDWSGQTPLLDPFCGSGTIPIEGAMLARRIAPGLRRQFAFMSWPAFDARAWATLTSQAESGALASSPVPITGSDRDAGAIEASQANAERAGVRGDIDFAVRPVSDVRPPPGRGLVATNPPYGVRVGDRSTVRNLYARFGQVVKDRFPGWRIALLSAESKLTAEIGLRFRRLLQTSNGGINVDAMIAEVADSAV
jgi:putative N6-adenine-specific DNA methylase